MSLVVLMSLPKARRKDPPEPQQWDWSQPQADSSLHLWASTVRCSDTSSLSSERKMHFFRKCAPFRTLTSSFVDGGGSELPILGILVQTCIRMSWWAIKYWMLSQTRFLISKDCIDFLQFHLRPPGIPGFKYIFKIIPQSKSTYLETRTKAFG